MLKTVILNVNGGGSKMSEIIGYFAVTEAEFWVGITLLACAIGLLLLAVRPESEYADLPRGEFPRPGEHHPTRHVSGGEPPMRSTPPQMRPQEAAIIMREAFRNDVVVSALLDLAVRGFIELVEYRYLPKATPAVIIVLLRGPDHTCNPDERSLLDLLAVPGRAENPPYAKSHPFDDRRFRAVLEDLGLPPVGVPTARLSGLRRSMGERVVSAVANRVSADFRWIRSGRESLASAGVVELLGGCAAAVLTTILVLAGSLRPFWLIVSVLLMVVGAATIMGALVRTTDGSVARDQARGFRRFLVEPPMGTPVEELASYSAWAVALDCVHEWVQSLERLSVVQEVNVAETVSGLVRTSEPMTGWEEVGDFITLIISRIHADPECDDVKSPTAFLSWRELQVE